MITGFNLVLRQKWWVIKKGLLILPLPQRYFRHPSSQGQAFGFKQNILLCRNFALKSLT